MASSPTGEKLMARAQAKAAESGRTLLDVIKPGAGSLTDTTLIRRFSADNPDKVVFEHLTYVYLNQNLKVIDAVLDLAHELSHFAYRAPFDPYRKSFSVVDFVRSTIEGKGGEVDAYLIECQVLQELFGKEKQGRYHCSKIKDPRTGRPSRKLAIKEFYKVGEEISWMKEHLGDFFNLKKELPQLSPHEAVFISSAYGMPYPMAAVKEYITVKGKVCKNDKKRLGYMKAKAASATSNKGRYVAMLEDYQNRCQSLL